MATDDRAGDESTLLGWLADRDVPCPLCGYNLRGLTAARCPECGQPLRLSVALTDPYLRAWITLAVALLLPAGLGLLWAVALAREGAPPGRQSSLIYPIVYQVACIPLATLALAGRRRVQRWPRGVQNRLAATAIALTLVSFAWVFQNLFGR